MKKRITVYQDFISKPEISFWVPIMTSVITVVLSYGFLMSRVSVLESKVDTLTLEFKELSQTIQSRYINEETRYGNLSTRVTRLEAQMGAK